jgi:hypothetical protein
MKLKKPKFKLYFSRNFSFTIIPRFKKYGLTWKDKFGTPRCEMSPNFQFEWLWFGIMGKWGCDRYWEQRLWFEEYSHCDYAEAKQTWPWISGHTQKSTWDDKLTKP